MKPITFPNQNIVIAENQEGVQPLPAYFDSESGILTTVWELDFVEIESIKQTGKIIVEIATYGKPVQPIYILTLHENERRRT